MDCIRIHGGIPLNGSVRVSGGKNAALAIMAGSLLCPEPVILHNVPAITDIETMSELLRSLGASVDWVGESSLQINAADILWLEAPYDIVRKMRASFHVLGPLLARFGKARVPVPGGCAIGARPVNFHIEGLKKLGAALHLEHGTYSAESVRLTGTGIYLDFQSAGATEHLMSAATLADGVTVIENAAVEPEVVDLANFLNAMGAIVEGAGTTTLTIHGVSALRGGEYYVISDRMEAGTFAIAAAITNGDVLIENVNTDHLRPVISKLTEAGIDIEEGIRSLRVCASRRPRCIDIKTMPHPGFPTDMQQTFAAMLATADGTSIITETVYESRFSYVNELVRMGAEIRVDGRTTLITGVEQLTGAKVAATDLRAGAALICAALGADGETEIDHVHHIDRGYDNIVGKLNALGAGISRGEAAEYGRAQHWSA